MSVIGAGLYEFGKNIPAGHYDLKVISGIGYLYWRNGEKFDSLCCQMGIGEGLIPGYRNMYGNRDDFFRIDGNLVVEITESKEVDVSGPENPFTPVESFISVELPSIEEESEPVRSTDLPVSHQSGKPSCILSRLLAVFRVFIDILGIIFLSIIFYAIFSNK